MILVLTNRGSNLFCAAPAQRKRRFTAWRRRNVKDSLIRKIFRHISSLSSIEYRWGFPPPFVRSWRNPSCRKRTKSLVRLSSWKMTGRKQLVSRCVREERPWPNASSMQWELKWCCACTVNWSNAGGNRDLEGCMLYAGILKTVIVVMLPPNRMLFSL